MKINNHQQGSIALWVMELVIVAAVGVAVFVVPKPADRPVTEPPGNESNGPLTELPADEPAVVSTDADLSDDTTDVPYAKGIIIARFKGLTKYSYEDIDERGLSALVYDDALFNIFDQYGLIRIEHLAGDLLSREGNQVTVKPSRERMLEVIEKYPTRSARGNIPEGYDPGFEHDYKLVFPENADVFSIIEELEQENNVEYATPNPVAPSPQN